MNLSNTEERILELLKSKHQVSGGHCGTYAVDIIHKLGLPYSELRVSLNNLYKEKLITVHDAQHGKLIKLKVKKGKKIP